MRLTLNHLEGKSILLQEKIESFIQKIAKGNFELKEREINSEQEKYSYSLLDGETNQIVAIVKSNPERPLSLYTELVPHRINNSATAREHEVIGCELDQLAGYDHTPLTFIAKLLLDGKPLDGVMQEYVPNAESGDKLHNLNGANLLKGMANSLVHPFIISGIFKGLGAGHIANYLFEFSGEGNEKRVKKIVEIDLEEMLPFCNKLSPSEIEKAIEFTNRLLA